MRFPKLKMRVVNVRQIPAKNRPGETYCVVMLANEETYENMEAFNPECMGGIVARQLVPGDHCDVIIDYDSHRKDYAVTVYLMPVVDTSVPPVPDAKK